MVWNYEEIDERLSRQLEPVLSSRRTARQVTDIVCALDPEQQRRVLALFDIAVASNEEVAYQFLVNVPRAIAMRGINGLHGWLLEALDRFDRGGMYPAIQLLHQIQKEGSVDGAPVHEGVELGRVARVLETFINALAENKLTVEPGEVPFTDGERIVVPERLAWLEQEEDNFQLYKVMATLQWAQLARGTFRLRLSEVDGAATGQPESEDDLGGLDAFLSGFEERALATELFLLAEGVRLEGFIDRELPGLGRNLAQLRGKLLVERVRGGSSPRAAALDALYRWFLGSRGRDDLQKGELGALHHRLVALGRPEAGVADSAGVAAELYRRMVALTGSERGVARISYLGSLRPAMVAANLRRRRESNAHTFRIAVAKLLGDLPETVEESELQVRPAQEGESGGVARVEPAPEGQEYELVVDGRSLELPDDVQGLVHTIIRDLGEIPPEYLVAGGNAPGYPVDNREESEGGEAGIAPDSGSFLYDEWDYRRDSYRKSWCVLRECAPPTSTQPVVERALKKYSGVVASLRRQFELLRSEERTLRRQLHGPDIDLDAAVEACGDRRAGLEPSERLFTCLQRSERNIAVAFLVDMSGSTKGWINRAQKESLALLCEALEVLGDRYAIYGFSGLTRMRCDFFKLKELNEPYDREVKMRIAGIEPQDYTRMGPAIRHATRLLAEVEARTHLLITLSDGKPDDWDHYRGDTGIEDTRRALIEAKRRGIHPFCITIDEQAHDYIPHMYGEVNYTLVKDVRALPRKIPEVYRRLTT